MLTRREVFAALPAAVVAMVPTASRAAASDSRSLQAAANELNLHSLLVWHQGRLQTEIYRTALDQASGSLFAREVAFGPDVLHDMRSISKSVVALLVGQAAARGDLSVDTPVLDFYPELSALRSQAAGAVTLAHLLHMSCGLQWNEGVATYGKLSNDETALYWKAEPARYLLDRPAVAPPGQVWNYNGGCTAVLADILRRKTGQDIRALAERDVFKPLDIETTAWRTGLWGQPLAYAGLRLTSPDLLKLGVLLLQNGRWAAQQVVPEAWVDAILTPHIKIGDGPLAYGHQWWAGTVQDKAGQSLNWTAGFGNGGQRLFVVPALQLVMLMTAGQYNSPAIGGAQLRLFKNVVWSLT